MVLIIIGIFGIRWLTGCVNQRVLKYGDIQNTGLTSDKELNILIYGMSFYIIICRSYTLK